MSDAVAALKEGAHVNGTKPLDVEELLVKLEQRRKLEREEASAQLSAGLGEDEGARARGGAVAVANGRFGAFAAGYRRSPRAGGGGNGWRTGALRPLALAVKEFE